MRTARTAVAVIAVIALAAGCSNSGGRNSQNRASAWAERRQGRGYARLKIATATHSGEGDTFWDIVQSGAKQAASKDNVDFLVPTTRKRAGRPSSFRPPSTRRSTGSSSPWPSPMP